MADSNFKSFLKDIGSTIGDLGIPIVSSVANMAMGILGSKIQKDTVNNHMSGAEREAFNLNAQEAQKARDWNLQMDSTKYQRQVTDMQKAGINPALAMNGGVSTQATSNAMANASTQQSPMMSVVDLATTAANLKNLKAQRQNIEADTKLKEANAEAISTENQYRDEFLKLRNEGQANANKLTTAQERETYKRIDKAEAEIAEINQRAKTEEEKQRNLAADTLLKEANARQIEALTPVLVKLREAETETQRAIAAQAFANAAYQQGLIKSGYIEALARKEGYNAQQAEQIALSISADNAKRGYSETMANGEEFYSGGFAKFFGTTFWQIADLLGSVLHIGVNYQGNTSDSRSTSTSTSTSSSTSTSYSTVHSYSHK